MFVGNTANRIIDSSSSMIIDENYWGTNNPNFRDLLSPTKSPTYIILNFTGPSEVSVEEATYVLNLNQLNTNKTIAEDSLHDYYINVRSNNLRNTTSVPIKNGIGYYKYSPFDLGEDVLSINDYLFRVNVTKIYLTANIALLNEYTNSIFAGTNNTIIPKIFVNKDFGTYTVKVYADGIKISDTIERLTRMPKEIPIIDKTIRPITSDTAAGANNPIVNYTIEVYGNANLIGNATFLIPLVYNGYLGKEYAYSVNDLEFDYNTTVTGDILIQIQEENTYIGGSSTGREYEWRTVLTEDSKFTSGFLYIPYNWDKTTTGPYPEFNLIFNNKNINNRIVGKYRDQSNLGGNTYGYGVLIYDVSDIIQNIISSDCPAWAPIRRIIRNICKPNDRQFVKSVKHIICG
jgi:hypothetical protein